MDAVRAAIAAEYRGLEIVAEVPIDGEPALIVHSPATEALVRSLDDLAKWFGTHRVSAPAVQPGPNPKTRPKQGVLF